MKVSALAVPNSLDGSSYDRLTILFHWSTAVLVLFQFTSSHVWEQFQKGTNIRVELISLHVASGIALTIIVIGRILWRSVYGRKLPPSTSGVQHVAATLVHYLLYALLAVQIALGILLGWSVGNPMNFFGLFSIPSPIAFSADTRHLLADLHGVTAWSIIALVGVHAAAALLHHYVLRDSILSRMLPFLRNEADQRRQHHGAQRKLAR